MKIKLIVAASENNVIGIKNDLPWHLPDDMKFFKRKTQDSTVIMGKNNYLSIPHKYRPLKNRTNIILTKDGSFKAKGCLVTQSVEQAIEIAYNINRNNIFIIGGGMVYKYAIENDLVDIIFLTRIHTHIEGDTFFPIIDMKKWKKTKELYHPKDANHQFDFTFIKLEKIVN